jgi:hypothetical protein
MAQPKSDWERQMQRLDGEIRRLEAEFNMFFAGRLPRPPWETRTRVAALIKQYDNAFIGRTADRFRFESLQSRFQKFIELCDRQLTNRELGRPMPGARRTAPKEPHKTPAERVVRFKREADDARVKELYEELAAARKAAGESPIAYERVAALVKAQILKLAADGADVAFKIATRDGKVQLTVRVETCAEG